MISKTEENTSCLFAGIIVQWNEIVETNESRTISKIGGKSVEEKPNENARCGRSVKTHLNYTVRFYRWRRRRRPKWSRRERRRRDDSRDVSWRNGNK